MDRTWIVVGVGGSPRVSSFGILGKRIKLALANNLMHYLLSTL